LLNIMKLFDIMNSTKLGVDYIDLSDLRKVEQEADNIYLKIYPIK